MASTCGPATLLTLLAVLLNIYWARRSLLQARRAKRGVARWQQRRRPHDPAQRRMTLVLGIVAGVGVAGALALRAFRENVMFYFDPSKVAAGQVKQGQRFRLGGMVVKGSVQRSPVR
jgi:hypothetical protein